MIRCLLLYGAAVLCLANCCCSPPQVQRFVPASTVVRMVPQPASCREFQAAEQNGYLVAATGSGPAFDVWDQPVPMYEGQALHVLRVDPESGDVLACRRDDHKLVRLLPEGLEVETTTYKR